MSNSRVGTSAGNLSSSTGGVIDELGNQLLGTDTTGSTAQNLGPGLARELNSGMTNGDFSLAPDDPDAPIDANNELPFWTVVNPDPEHVEIVLRKDPSATASGQMLQFNIKPGANYGASGGTTNTFYIERYIPVPATTARSFYFEPRTHWSGSTGASSANIYVWGSARFVKRDFTNTEYGGLVGTGSAVLTGINRELQINPGDGFAFDPDASYMLYRTGITITGAVTTNERATIYEMRMDRGTIQTLLVDVDQPGFYKGGDYIFNGTYWFGAESPIVNARMYLSAESTSSPTGNGTYNFYNVAPYGGTYTGASTNTTTGTITKLDLSTRVSYGGGMPSPSSDQLIPPAGLYLIVSRVAWEANGAGDYRRYYLYKNGSSIGSTITSVVGSLGYALALTTTEHFNGTTDYLDVRAQQDSGVTLTANVNELTLIRLGAKW